MSAVFESTWPRVVGRGAPMRLSGREFRITGLQDANLILSILFILSRVRAVSARDEGVRSKFSVRALSQRKKRAAENWTRPRNGAG